MGVGKTTIGRQLADDLRYTFLDTDREIEAHTGADIPWIFDVEGEEGFRKRESRVLEDVCAGSAAIVATGGGIVMADENRNLIKSNGTTVYLHATLEQQLERTSKDRNRPLLNGEDPEQVLRELIAVREPHYRDLADIVYQTDNRNPRNTASEIARQIEQL